MAVSCWSGMGRLVTGRRAGGGAADASGAAGGDHELNVTPARSSAGRRLVDLDGKLHRLLELLPEDAGGSQQLRDFWATFAALDLRPVLTGRTWTHADCTTLYQVRQRCLVATYPFSFALSVLLEGWQWRSDELSRSPARSAAKAVEQWNALLVVQRVLGPLDTASRGGARPWNDNFLREISDRREQYLELARIFQLVAAMLWRAETGDDRLQTCRSHAEVEQACVNEVNLFLSAQHMVPAEWRWR